MANYTVHGVYLMGQLYGRDGSPCPGARYFPLPYETMVLPDSLWKEDKTYIKPDSVVAMVRAENPLAYSDKYGKLTFFNEDKQPVAAQVATGKTVTLTGSPVAVKQSSLGKTSQRNVLFFPSYMVPMFIGGEEEGKPWLPALYQKLKNQTQYFTTDITTLDPISERHLLLALPEGEALTELTKDSPYFEHYHHWLSTLGSEPLHILTVPQYYTIVVNFSSAKYVGATVTLSELPPGVVVMGTEKQSVSKVKLVNFMDMDGTDQPMYCATFWIESNILPTLDKLEQYCRIDINTATVNLKFTNEFSQKGLSTYSLKERVLHLPVKTIIGRCSLVNGDPISVEEALFNHVPAFYKDMTDRLNKQPYDLPEQVTASTAEQRPITAEMWHQLQSYKGFFEAGTAALENGPTWQMLSKLAHASLSEALANDNSDLARATLAAVGVTGASMEFVEAVADLKSKNPLVTQANLIRRALDQQAVSGIPFPNSARPFLTKLGAVGNTVLGLPLTALETVYNLTILSDSHQKATKADDAFLNDVTRYAVATISPSANKLLALKQDPDTLTQKEQDVMRALKQALAAMVVKDGNGDHNSASLPLNNTLLRLDSTTFGFDRATPNFKNANVEEAFQAIGKQLAKLSDPIDIQIAGHTCDIGSVEYNKKLSLARAESVKQSILATFKDAKLKAVWSQRIKVLGYGEDQPLVKNLDIASRRKNRRVDILLNFSSQFDYPACRSGMTLVEKSRKTSTASLMKMEEDIVNAAGSAFDLALLGVTPFFPPAGLLTATKQGLALASTILKEADNVSGVDKAKLSQALDQLYHADITLSSQLITESGIKTHQAVIMKAYLKRTLALNGLIRLIQQYQYDQVAGKINYVTSSGMVVERDTLSYKEYDISGYINAFLLNDDWEVENGLLGPVHLDKLWLENNGKNTDSPWQRTWAATLAQGRYVYARYNQSEDGKDEEALAQHHNRYFPIHHMLSESEARFKKLAATQRLTNLDSSVFKHIIISARSPGATSADSWQPFLDYYKGNGSCLSPYDHIRILVVLDKEKIAQGNDDNLFLLPIAARAISTGLTGGDWHFFDKVASETVEYASPLNKADLMKHEKNVLNKAEDTVLGAIIQPDFSFGVHQIMGTRPVADYDDDVLKSLFDESDQANSASKARVSGAMKYLSYFYQVGIPGQQKTDTHVTYREKSVSFFDLSRALFNLTLSPTREYEFTKDFVTRSPSVKGDQIFYEKSFLSIDSPGQKRQYPEIFDSPAIDFYLSQPGARNKENDENNQADPLSKHRRLTGEIENFNWNDVVVATVIARTKAVTTDKLKQQVNDTNCIPLPKAELQLARTILVTQKIPLADINCLYRLGRINVDKDNCTFIPAQYQDDTRPSKISSLQQAFARLTAAELKMKAVEEGLIPQLKKSVSTDIYANTVKLKYINALGVEVEGLTPLIYPSDLYAKKGGLTQVTSQFNKFCDFYLTLNGPEGSGLEGKSENIIIYGQPKSVPKNWYKTESKKAIAIANEQNQTNALIQGTDSSATDLGDYNISRLHTAATAGDIEPHNITRLMQWAKSNPNNMDDITDERVTIIEDWVGI
ncbi:OmpA family protein [Photobacterium nomapromontoriensis]|uniref:OmpA family protein n=1 Tax=Photobacterium nomapromontoriensis TaxID=2910237 RepID=UPI003D0C4AA1